jgi:hypothetical protein
VSSDAPTEESPVVESALDVPDVRLLDAPDVNGDDVIEEMPLMI